MAYAVVRTDNMAGTDVRGQLVSVKYMGADGATPTEIENGHVLKIGALMEGEREIYVGADVAANDPIEDVVLIATPELMYDERKHNLADYINEAGKALRGYHIHKADTFSLTAEAFDGDPAVGMIVELADGTKFKCVENATSGSTKVGRIIEKQVIGNRFVYWAIKVD